jgi:cyclophilin family peptidyl-prolyl cis-trans isomerase
MSATPPQPLEGTQSPSQIEFLWERYRKPFNLIVTLLLCVVAGFYVFKFLKQRETNAYWSSFAVNTGLDEAYITTDVLGGSLADSLGKLDLAKLEALLASAEPVHRPYVLLAIARKAMQTSNWDRAESALATLEKDYPKHSLVAASDYPVQIREEVKKEEKDDTAAQRNKKPELKPAKAGSAVSLLREQIAAAKSFTPPSQFAKPEIPADAKKVKIDFSGDYGSVTIALLANKAPKHCEEFLKLATREGGAFWKDLNVDEIQRNGTSMAKRPKQMHIGFETTKEAERDKWTKTEPSKHLVEWEVNDLSHFPGAVAARVEADGKSCADRFWIVADDAAEEDGKRVIFGFVVDGLDTIKKICEAPMSTQEEEAGLGMPSDKVTVTAVTVL